ncbi:MAG: DUF4268 domain-containing protein [Thermodesulfobacteriota bacterium]|nr:MAG: DUF4268 domain-containing protein [Thermodesulfobacteriota bacterium]
MLGKLELVKPREVWENETKFTEWLSEHLDVLNEQLGFELVAQQLEAPIGCFFADLIAIDEVGRTVVIENQLGETDHTHLGQLLTYISSLISSSELEKENKGIVGIWIASETKKEHVRAVEYLNRITPEDVKFYLIKMQLFRIGDSKPAPLFTIEAGPIEELTKKKREPSKIKEEYLKFFKDLLQKCRKKTKLFNNVSPVGYQSWINAGAGKNGIAWSLVILRDHARVELCFCHSDKEVNKRRFEFFAEKKEEIEKEFGEPLEWNFRDDRIHQYIRSKVNEGGLKDKELWERIQEKMVEKLVKLEGIFTSLIKKLPI